VAGFGLWEFTERRRTCCALPGLNPNFATQFAIYTFKVRAAIFDEYHLIFRATAIRAFCRRPVGRGDLAAAARPRWR